MKLDEILVECYLAFTFNADITVAWRGEGRFKVASSAGTWTVSLEKAFVDEDDEGKGILLTTRPDESLPAKIRHHFDVLETCLVALKRSQLAISSLTTDGDGSSCEAIFHAENDGYLVLKIR